jgi:hypothetical protein
MKDYDNSAFYHSAAWLKVSAAYMQSKHYICERCGKPAQICHHKIWLNGANINDPAIALSFDNLEALCIDCHNAEHGRKHSVTLFNKDGSIKGVKESQEAKDFERQRRKIDDLLTRLKEDDRTEAP